MSNPNQLAMSASRETEQSKYIIIRRDCTATAEEMMLQGEKLGRILCENLPVVTLARVYETVKHKLNDK
jgi:hypothetical protein